MKEFRTLKVLDRFQGLFGKLGADYPVMRSILQVKLTMDARRVPTVIGGSSGKRAKETDDGKGNIGSFSIYALIGAIMIPFILWGNNYMFQMSIVFGILMFMITTSMISDFSSVLLDIRDKSVLHTRPVHRKTIAMAKTVHIVIYLFFLTASITAAPLSAALFRHGIGFFLLFLANIVLADALIVALTALMYLVILKFFDGEKLKDFINFVQIGLSIAITVGYQLIGRAFNLADLHIVFVPKWWHALILPVWFAAPFEWLLHGRFDWPFIAFTMLAFLVPVLSILAYVRLMPSFERYLQKLSDNSANGGKEHDRWTDRLALVICRSMTEQAFFRFASRMMRNEREFKLKVYPTLGFSMIFPFIFLLSGLQKSGLSGLQGTRWYLAIYSAAMMIPSVIMMLRFSGNYKGAWIYAVAPLKEHSLIHKGTLKAFLSRLFLPIFLIEAAVFTFLFGLGVIPHLLAAVLAMLLYTVVCYRAVGRALPFSEAFGPTRQSNGMKTVPLLFLIILLPALHFVFTLVGYGVYLYAVVLLVLNLGVWKMAIR